MENKVHPKIEQFKKKTYRLYTMGEEIFHSVSHGIGAAFSIAGLTLLLVLASRYGNVNQIVSFSIYGATMVILYLASTLYHSIQDPQMKHVFRIIDHSAIYLLIAGTYTPFLLIGLNGTWGWTLLIVIWGLALLGISFKVLFIGRFPMIATLSYILMGWLCVITMTELWAMLPFTGLVLLATGGVVYTVGVIFYALNDIPYTHAIWHLFVLGGSACHYFAVLYSFAPG